MKIKRVCPECKRRLNTSCFKYNRVLKKDICRTCNRKIGSNPFYTQIKSVKKISTFSLTDNERKVIANKNGWKRANYDCAALKTMKRIVSRKKAEEKINELKKKSNDSKLNKRFLEGLK